MKITWTFLSHPLTNDTPGFGGATTFHARQTRAIQSGDSSNQQEWALSNHTGSHMDAPLHFCDKGPSITDYSAQELSFQKTQLIKYSAKPDELIDLRNLSSVISQDTDALLLQTGFQKYREESAYWQNNPGISAVSADWLRRERPLIRLIGFDFISLTAFQYREEGRAAHRHLLSHREASKAILILEDLKLDEVKQSPDILLASPLRVSGADGSPVTAWAGFFQNPEKGSL